MVYIHSLHNLGISKEVEYETKKKSKNPRETRIGQTPNNPPTYPIFDFFWNIWKHKKQHKEPLKG